MQLAYHRVVSLVSVEMVCDAELDLTPSKM